MNEEKETFSELLSDAIGLTFGPIEGFYELLDQNDSFSEFTNLLLVLRKLLDSQQTDLEKIYEVINRTLGKIILEAPTYKKVVEFEGRKFKFGEFIQAVLKPVKADKDHG